MAKENNYEMAVKAYCRSNGIALVEDETPVEPGNFICPFCGGDEIFGTGKPWITAKGLYLKTGCGDCGQEWQANYKYIGWQKKISLEQMR
jgi:predicted RNA-binding Zn-ribbon protein involved in translation (DUF1610 family)